MNNPVLLFQMQTITILYCTALQWTVVTPNGKQTTKSFTNKLEMQQRPTTMVPSPIFRREGQICVKSLQDVLFFPGLLKCKDSISSIVLIFSLAVLTGTKAGLIFDVLPISC